VSAQAPSTVPETAHPPAAAAAGGRAVSARAGTGTPPGWQVWGALWIVYLVWGSTYLAIRVMVETVPPLLGAGARFAIAGAVLLLVLRWRLGWTTIRPTRGALLGAGLVGLLLPGANAVVSVAEQHVPSSLAALLIASIPLWVILLRRLAGETITRAGGVAVLVGFVGVALLVRPGPQSADASIVGMLTCVAAAVMWASGSFASGRVELPRHPLVSTGWQMLIGGIACLIAGLLAGEGPRVDPAAFSTRSLLALLYLIVMGSWVAFSAYVWLLQNAPISKVATYAYVNPVVAIVLGWLILSEVVAPVTIAGAAIIVAAVALAVRSER
jgi:drug/metabolite transporter (DMT)-like permease